MDAILCEDSTCAIEGCVFTDLSRESASDGAMKVIASATAHLRQSWFNANGADYFVSAGALLTADACALAENCTEPQQLAAAEQSEETVPPPPATSTFATRLGAQEPAFVSLREVRLHSACLRRPCCPTRAEMPLWSFLATPQSP